MMKKISVIIPVYNVEKYVEKCIQSVLQQEACHEIIIIDDGSKDNSYQICVNYAQQYSHIKLIHTENRGLSAARNLGIELAEGEYIQFVDSDDFLPNEEVLKNIQYIIHNCEPDIIVGRTIFFNHNLQQCTGEDRLFARPGLVEGNVFDTMVNEQFFWIQSYAVTKIVKKQFIIQNQLFFEEGIFHEDDLWIGQCLATNPKIYLTNDIIYGVRRRDDSIMRTHNPEWIYRKACSKLRVSYELCKLLVTKDVEPVTKDVIMRNYISFYIDGAKKYRQIDDKKIFLKELSRYKGVLAFAKYTTSRNLKTLYLLSRCSPICFWTWLILKRYKVANEEGIS